MHVERVGYAPLKGSRHLTHPAVELGPEGPAGDRVLCLVDPARERVLRTVENPAMVQVRAEVAGGVLTVRLPTGPVSGALPAAGEARTVDYWGRSAEVELLDGPWACALSTHVGYDVVLARPRRPQQVVYGAPVTLVTTSSLARLADAVGGPVDDARFRATFLVDTGDAPAHVEDDWVGRELRLGEATVRVAGVVPRCAVVDLDPVSGGRNMPVLAALAGYRRREEEIRFGVDAVVVAGGRVAAGDAVVLGRN